MSRSVIDELEQEIEAQELDIERLQAELSWWRSLGFFAIAIIVVALWQAWAGR